MIETVKERIWKEHIVLPAIHARTSKQVIENLKIVEWEWADGFFLVNNKISSPELLNIYRDIQWKFDSLFHWINDLWVSPDQTFLDTAECRTDWIWVDNPRIQAVNGIDETDVIEQAKQTVNRKWLYFWWVAFKYQKAIPEKELPHAIDQAKLHMDVLTTSGSATWNAANIDEIKKFHAHAWWFPIALASGITPDNIWSYAPYIDVSIVATWISQDFFNLDRNKLKKLIRRCK